MKTLLDMSNDALAAGNVKGCAIMELLTWSNLLRALPFEDTPGDSFMKIAGGDLDVDRADVQRERSERSKQEAAKVRKLSRHLNRILIEGDTSKDPRDPSGLRRRVRQSHIVEGPVNPATLAAGFKLVPKATHLLMSNTTLQENRFPTVWDKDKWGHRVASYGWADPEIFHLTPILLAGLDENDQPVLPHGAFVLRLGEGGFHGVQNGPPEVTDLGLMQSKPVLRTRVEWLINLVDHPDSIAFITG